MFAPHQLRAARALATLFLLSLAVVLMGSCDSGPCHGSECAGSSSGSGNFEPGPLPHSAVHLDGPRCANGGAHIELFQHRMFTEPDPPAPVHTSDLLVVYWSVCNTGDLPSEAQSAVYDYVVTRVTESGSTELERVTFDIPPLEPCYCTVAQRSSQNVLSPGRYEFALTGGLTANVPRVISE